MKYTLALFALTAMSAHAATNIMVGGLYKCSEITTMSPSFEYGAADAECNKAASSFADSQKYMNCKEGLSCSSNKCKAAATTKYATHGSTSCTSSSDCEFQNGDDVFNGACVSDKCYYNRYAGDACKDDKDCKAGGATKLSCTSGKCTSSLKADDACTYGADCPVGYGCVASKCAKYVAVGGDCSGNNAYNCVPGAGCNTKGDKCAVYYSLATGTETSNSMYCATGNSESNKCAAVASTGSGTKATDAACENAGECKQLTDNCLCTGSKASKCVTVNANYVSDKEAQYAKLKDLSTCKSTSGCSVYSQDQDPGSCVHSCMPEDAKTTCVQWARMNAGYFGYVPSNAEMDPLVVAYGAPENPCEAGASAAVAAAAAVAVAVLARMA